MVGDITINGNPFIYTVVDKVLCIFSKDQSLLSDLMVSPQNIPLIGSRYDGRYDIFYEYYPIGISLGTNSHARYGYSVRVESGYPEPTYSYIQIAGAPISWFFDSKVIKYNSFSLSSQEISIEVPEAEWQTVFWKDLELNARPRVSISYSVDPEKPLSSRCALQVGFPRSFTTTEVTEFISDVRKFFAFLYNTNSIGLEVSSQDDILKTPVNIEYANLVTDRKLIEYNHDKFSYFFEDWATSLSEFFKLDLDTNYIPSSSDAIDSIAHLYLVAPVFEGLHKKFNSLKKDPIFEQVKKVIESSIKSLRKTSTPREVPHFRFILGELKNMQYKPKLLTRMLDEFNAQSFWLDDYVDDSKKRKPWLKINDFSDIANCCYTTRNRFAHGSDFSFKDQSEIFCIKTLEMVVYCMILKTIKADVSELKTLTWKLFHL